MADEGLSEFVCPECESPVEENWVACPSCGLKFGAQEDEAPPAAAVPPKPPAAAAKPSTAPPARASKPARPPKRAKPAVDGGMFAQWPLIGPLARRVGTLGAVGLGLMVAGFVGFVLVSNYDTLFAGRAVNTVGASQANFVLAMAVAAATGAGLSVIGFLTTRGFPGDARPVAYGEMDEIPARASAAPDAQGQSVKAEAPGAPQAAEPPAGATAAATATEGGAEDEDEDEGAFELPPSTPATAAEAVSTSDELEDLFGELESEVQAAVDDEEVAYECPSCHGIVKEEDSSCPHCQVVFEA